MAGRGAAVGDRGAATGDLSAWFPPLVEGGKKRKHDDKGGGGGYSGGGGTSAQTRSPQAQAAAPYGEQPSGRGQGQSHQGQPQGQGQSASALAAKYSADPSAPATLMSAAEERQLLARVRSNLQLVLGLE